MLNILQCQQTCSPWPQQQRVTQPKMLMFMIMRNSSIKQKLLTATTNCVLWQILFHLLFHSLCILGFSILFLSTSTVYIRFDNWWSASEKHPKQVHLAGIILRSSQQQSVWAAKRKGHSFLSVQSLSCVRLLVIPRTAARQASLSNANSRSPPKPMSIELVMPSSHLILCCSLLLLPSIFPSIRVFSNESALRIRWPKYWSFSFNISSLRFLKLTDQSLEPGIWILTLAFLPSWSKQHGCLSLPGLIFPNFTLCFNILICTSNACFVYSLSHQVLARTANHILKW